MSTATLYVHVSVPAEFLEKLYDIWTMHGAGPPPFRPRPAVSDPQSRSLSSTVAADDLQLRGGETSMAGEASSSPSEACSLPKPIILILPDPRTIVGDTDAIKDAVWDSAVAAEVLFVWQQLFSGLMWKTLGPSPGGC
jgi:hypothetical protein